jgi:hypothetical protein
MACCTAGRSTSRARLHAVLHITTTCMWGGGKGDMPTSYIQLGSCLSCAARQVAQHKTPKTSPHTWHWPLNTRYTQHLVNQPGTLTRLREPQHTQGRCVLSWLAHQLQLRCTLEPAVNNPGSLHTPQQADHPGHAAQAGACYCCHRNHHMVAIAHAGLELLCGVGSC